MLKQEFGDIYMPYSNHNIFNLIINDSVNGTIILQAENEDEKRLMEELKKTIKRRLQKEAKKNPNIIVDTDKIERDKNTLNKGITEFLEFKGNKLKGNKTYLKYKQISKLLLTFFGSKKLIKDITAKDAVDFTNFLLTIPKNHTHIKELQNINLAIIYKKNKKILEKYESLNNRTVADMLKRAKSVFNYFVDVNYIANNPFNSIDVNINKGQKPTWRNFKKEELQKLLDNIKDIEMYNYFYFLLHTGLRRGESLKIQVKHVHLDKGILEITEEVGTKTNNAKRIVPIHKNLINILEKQVKEKNKDDFLFFSDYKYKNRENNLGLHCNKVILDILGEDVKKFVNLHSFRKNFAQAIFTQTELKDIDIKAILGHSTQKDITDMHYLLGIRNYKQWKKEIDKVDFFNVFVENKWEDNLLSII